MFYGMLSRRKLESCKDDPREAAHRLAQVFGCHRLLREPVLEIILAAKDYVALLTRDGTVIEPEEGFLAIGAGASVATGAIKALLLHSSLPSEHIVRQSLLIAAQFVHPGNREITLEVLS
jgi:ATP-dependent HslUV protease subunit HslV